MKARLALATKIALAVHDLHTGKKSQTGLCYSHGDLKPENITVDAMGEVHLIDLGTAKVGIKLKLTNYEQEKIVSQNYSPLFNPNHHYTAEQKDIFMLKGTLMALNQWEMPEETFENLFPSVLTTDICEKFDLQNSISLLNHIHCHDIDLSAGVIAVLLLQAKLQADGFKLNITVKELSSNNELTGLIIKLYKDHAKSKPKEIFEIINKELIHEKSALIENSSSKESQEESLEESQEASFGDFPASRTYQEESSEENCLSLEESEETSLEESASDEALEKLLLAYAKADWSIFEATTRHTGLHKISEIAKSKLNNVQKWAQIQAVAQARIGTLMTFKSEVKFLGDGRHFAVHEFYKKIAEAANITEAPAYLLINKSGEGSNLDNLWNQCFNDTKATIIADLQRRNKMKNHGGFNMLIDIASQSNRSQTSFQKLIDKATEHSSFVSRVIRSFSRSCFFAPKEPVKEGVLLLYRALSEYNTNILCYPHLIKDLDTLMIAQEKREEVAKLRTSKKSAVSIDKINLIDTLIDNLRAYDNPLTSAEISEQTISKMSQC